MCFQKKMVLLIALFGVLVSPAFETDALAIERKPLIDVDSDALAIDTQSFPFGTRDDHVALAWWIPIEFWTSTLERDPSFGEADKAALVGALQGLSILGVVQGDISPLGSFNFYPMDEVEQNLWLRFRDANGKEYAMNMVSSISGDLEIVLGAMRIILGSAIGELGNNIHFFVLDDSASDRSRLLDPYQPGEIVYSLLDRDGRIMNGSIGLPLNALFVPRKCPNGKDAHVSWNFCPWSGTPLER